MLEKMYDLAESIKAVKCLQGNKIMYLKSWLIQQEKKTKQNKTAKKNQQYSLLTVSSNCSNMVLNPKFNSENSNP